MTKCVKSNLIYFHFFVTIIYQVLKCPFLNIDEVIFLVMSRIWCIICIFSVISAISAGRGSGLAAAIAEGAGAGVTLGISLAGSLALWSGVGRLMEAGGITAGLSKLLMPILGRVFPGGRQDEELGAAICGNVCANFLGLGNAATPMGIRAVERMIRRPGEATDEMCRLIVLNTASIQLIPTTVAAVRGSLGSARPFDILTAVWITSLCSAGLGLAAAYILGKVWRDD